MANLVLDPAADAMDVQVAVKDGVVTLLGAVQSWQEKQLAEYLAKGVAGVRGVVNQLAVEYKARRPDPEISWAEARAAAENSFEGGAVAVDNRLLVE